MIISDLHFIGVSIPPQKADSPLIVDPDTVLPLSVARQLLKAVARRDS
jgi:hypothetical protein